MRLNETGKQGTLFIDFDGTLIDNQIRHFLVYEQIAKSLNLENILNQNMYWQMRRKGFSFAAVFEKKHGLLKSQSVKNKYIQIIEKSDLLEEDILIRNVKKFLGRAAKKYNIVLVSLRRKKRNFLRQLKHLELNAFFDEINVSASGKDSVKTKQSMIKKSKFYGQKPRYLIGDTEIDVLSGKNADCKVIAVFSGIRKAELLRGYNPNYLIKSISDIEKIIKL